MCYDKINDKQEGDFMINRDEALSIQKERSKRCIIASIVSVIILAATAILLSVYVASSSGEVLFYAILAIIIEIFILRKVRFTQLFEPIEQFVKVVKNEAVTVSQRSFSGANGPAATYDQDQLNQIQMTLVDKNGKEFIKRYPYKSELGTIKAGDELVLMRFVYEPVVIS